MAKIIGVNNDTNKMETYYRGTNRSLTVGEFRGTSGRPTLWTTKRAMQSWNATRDLYGTLVPLIPSWVGKIVCK